MQKISHNFSSVKLEDHCQQKIKCLHEFFPLDFLFFF